MKRRSHMHDYSHSGLYHITISTAKDLHQPLGHMAGRLDKPDGDSEAPHVVLSPLGQMVEQELTKSIQQYYPMLKVLDYVIMPEHIHFLLVAYRNVVSRSGRPTHLSLRALKGYLLRECPPSQMTDEVWLRISELLLVKGGMIYCDRYGSDELLAKRLLPVVCHRKDAALHDMQQQRCMDAADEGDVLVSARIARREQIIMAALQKQTYPVVLIADNGFPEIFHPSEEKQTLCAAGRLMLLTPWKYHYRKVDEGITVAECKTMNCITQAVCRLRDDWWT